MHLTTQATTAVISFTPHASYTRRMSALVVVTILGLSAITSGHAQHNVVSVTPAAKAVSASGVSQFIPQEFAGFGTYTLSLHWLQGRK